MIVVGLCPMIWRRTGERPFSFGARLWCDVPAAAFDAKPNVPAAPSRASCGTGGGLALTVSGEEGNHSSLPHARAAPHWLWSAYVLHQSTAPARGLSPSAPARSATCQLRRPTPSRLCHAAQVLQRSLLFGKRRSTQSLLRVLAVLRWLWSVQGVHQDAAPARGLSRSARGCGATCQLRPLTLVIVKRKDGTAYHQLLIKRKDDKIIWFCTKKSSQLRTKSNSAATSRDSCG